MDRIERGLLELAALRQRLDHIKLLSAVDPLFNYSDKIEAYTDLITVYENQLQKTVLYYESA